MQNRNQTTTVRLHIEDIFEGSMGMEVTQKHEEETLQRQQNQSQIYTYESWKRGSMDKWGFYIHVHNLFLVKCLKETGKSDLQEDKY